MCSGGELKVEVVNEVVVTLVLECEWFHVNGDYGPNQVKLVVDGFDIDWDGLFPIVEEVLNLLWNFFERFQELRMVFKKARVDVAYLTDMEACRLGWE